MHVVLVAADPSLMRALTTILEKRVHDVVCFASPQEALVHVAAHEDINAMIVVESCGAMPGPEICWEARLLESFERPLYICLICRPLNSRLFIEALDCGADDVLQLPLSSDELYARLRAAQRFIQMQRKLVDMATRDELTGLLNRPAFFSRTAKLRHGRDAPLAVVMADIDHFKAVNDCYGHAAGDKALRAVADCFDGPLKANLAARMGGEEFALLLDGVDADEAARAAESWRHRIAKTEIDTGAGALRLSCSFGVAVGAPEDDIDALLRKADAALYAAKRAGRNRVAFYDADIPALQARPASLIRAPRPSVFGPRRQSCLRSVDAAGSS